MQNVRKSADDLEGGDEERESGSGCGATVQIFYSLSTAVAGGTARDVAKIETAREGRTRMGRFRFTAVFAELRRRLFSSDGFRLSPSGNRRAVTQLFLLRNEAVFSCKKTAKPRQQSSLVNRCGENWGWRARAES